MPAVSGRILIVDGHNNFIRSWAVVPTLDANGEHVGGVTGFLSGLRARLTDVGPERIIVVWDGKGGSAKRRGVLAEYKAGRKPHTNRKYDFGETPDEGHANLQMQHRRLRSYLGLIGVTQIEIDDIEADDVIGFLCRHVFDDRQKVVVSSDKDFLQLVDARTIVYSGSKKAYLGSARVLEEHGVLAENFIYLKALAGDGSDNIAGIKPKGSKQGFGPKSVVKLFPFLGTAPSSLDEIVVFAAAHVDRSPKYVAVVEQRDRLEQNIGLMQLTVPIIGSRSVAAIRHSLEGPIPSFSMTEFKMALLRDGMQLTDPELFGALSEYNVRRQRARSDQG